MARESGLIQNDDLVLVVREPDDSEAAVLEAVHKYGSPF